MFTLLFILVIEILSRTLSREMAGGFLSRFGWELETKDLCQFLIDYLLITLSFSVMPCCKRIWDIFKLYCVVLRRCRA